MKLLKIKFLTFFVKQRFSKYILSTKQVFQADLKEDVHPYLQILSPDVSQNVINKISKRRWDLK